MADLKDLNKEHYYPGVVCFPCGNTYGRGIKEGSVCACYPGTCGVCGKATIVTEPRDFGHLKFDWQAQAKANGLMVPVTKSTTTKGSK